MLKLLGVAVALGGLALLIERHWLIGPAFIALGAGLVNGARRDTWLSFDFGGSGCSPSGSWDGDAGGDGGGD